MSEPILTLPQHELDMLDRYDKLYREGLTQDQIAAREDPPRKSEAIRTWMARRGWKFNCHRFKGPRIINSQDGSEYKTWRESGDLAPRKELTNARK